MEWTQELRARISPEKRAEYQAYMEALEAIPLQAAWATAPESIAIPDPPVAAPTLAADLFTRTRSGELMRDGSTVRRHMLFGAVTDQWEDETATTYSDNVSVDTQVCLISIANVARGNIYLFGLQFEAKAAGSGSTVSIQAQMRYQDQARNWGGWNVLKQVTQADLTSSFQPFWGATPVNIFTPAMEFRLVRRASGASFFYLRNSYLTIVRATV